MNVITDLYGHVRDYRRPQGNPSLIERLPQDMLVLILQSIGSLRSLRAAVLAFSAMYDAFRTAKIETLACVVSRSRPRDIVADAIGLSVLMNLHNQSNANIMKSLLMKVLCEAQKEPQHLTEHYMQMSRKAQQEWSYLPRDLTSPDLLQFHWFVEYFTDRLFHSAMRYVYRKGWSGTYKLKFRKLSYNETTRIQRALYRMESFKLLMRLNIMSADGLKLTPYWRRHVTVWDMEEIACVRQLLYERLSVLDDTILDLIEHSHLLGGPYKEGSKSWRLVITNIIKCLIMSQELRVLFRLLSKPESQHTYWKIHDIVCESLQPSMSDGYIYHQLSPGVRVAVMDSLFDDASPHPQGRVACALHLERVLHPQDSIIYPSFGWLRAYRQKTFELVEFGGTNATESSLYDLAERSDDRRWGYCLWDKERMELWGDKPGPGLKREQARLRVTSPDLPGWVTTRLNQ